MKTTKVPILSPPLVAFEHKRDAYGFAVRPYNVQRYREYANIYKEEEEEWSDSWKDFLERQSEGAQLPVNGGSDKAPEGDDLSSEKPGHDDLKPREDEVS
ncbi:unnamed protein product [Lactuca virosa]|uniref:Uncharacterized protein n=1 Tax=Lactuca virosa TaxID=75947 RepID=A0AAU9MLV4_9ASTR|nr:unnamed protein product [Lactuca virosa]